MVDVIPLSAQPRDRAGKGAARAVRRAGFVPAVIYGGKEAPLTISLDPKALEKELHKSGFFNTLIDVGLDGTNHRVLARDVQFHPVTDRALHVDFLRVSANTRITVAVPVEFVNEEDSPGIKRGGVLNIVRHEVDLDCRAEEIPHILTADLAGLDINDSIHISSIALPDGVTPTITDRDFTIATIAAPTVVRDEEVEEQEAAEAEAEAEETEGEDAGDEESEGEESAEESGDGEDNKGD